MARAALNVHVLFALMILGLAVVAIPFAGDGSTGAQAVDGTFVLGPLGGPNASKDLWFDVIGVSLHSGDTLRFSWSVDNASGPAVDFLIFGHTAASHDAFLRRHGTQSSGTWSVPTEGSFGATWSNPSAAPVTISYSFEPSSDSSDVVVLTILGLFLILGVAVAWAYYRTIRSEEARSPSVGEEAEPVSEPEGSQPPPRG